MKLLVTSAFSVLVLASTAMSQSQGDCVDQTASIVCSAKSNNGFCGSINYTSFAIPNFRNSTEEMEIDIELQTYTILYSSGCSNALVHLLCGYYKPPCYSGPNAEAIRLTPCRELCLYVRSSCEPVFTVYNATWPDHLDCDQFPLKGDENGPICFPDFHALEDYQTRLELPPIRGAPSLRPSTVVTAERFWSPDCPGSPEAPTLVSGIAPTAHLSWSPPSASGAWSYTYEVSWTNGSVIVPRQAGTIGQITGLHAETEYTVVVTAYPDGSLCPDQFTTFSFNLTQNCPSSPPMFSGSPIVQSGVVTVSWTAAVAPIRRLAPPVTGIRYALYSQCVSETTFQLLDDDIQGVSYDITTLPSLTQCVLRVVVYSDHCLLDVDGPLGATTDNFTTVCEVNEYVHPTSGVCTACPTNSTSVGGTPSMCTCNAGTGRVNATDVTLPCVEPPCPPECSHKFCQKKNPNALCSVPGEFTAPSCTGTCHVTNCRACYYSRTVQTCQKHCKYDCGEDPSLRCLKKWSQCVKKGLQKDGKKRAKTFKCVDPCKCLSADSRNC